MHVHGVTQGTGFFVATDYILTAGHVVGPDTASVAVVWNGVEHVCAVHRLLAGNHRPVADLSPWPDLAVLEVPAGAWLRHPCVRLRSTPFSPRTDDRYLTFGFPREGGSIEMSPRTLQFRGEHAKRVDAASSYYDSFKSDDVAAGFSGAPLLGGDDVDHVIVASRDPTSDKGCLAVRLSEISELDDLRGSNEEFHERDRRWDRAADPGLRRWLVAAAALVVCAIVVALLVWPDPPVPSVEAGAVGIGVTPIEEAGDLSDALANELESLTDVSDCGLTPRAIDVLDADALGSHPPSDENDHLGLTVIVEGVATDGVTEEERRVGLRLRLLSLSARNIVDPYLLGEIELAPATIDLGALNDRSMLDVFPELKSLPMLLNALARIDTSSTEALDAARCSLDAARRSLGTMSARTSPVASAIDVLLAVTWIRQEGLEPGSVCEVEDRASLEDQTSSTTSDSAVTASDCARSWLDSARDPTHSGRPPSGKMTAIIDANETGITFLELVEPDGTLSASTTTGDVDAAISDFTQIGRLTEQSPAGKVLTLTLAAKLALAAANHLVANGDTTKEERTKYLETAASLVSEALESAGADVNSFRADAFATRGIVALEQRRPAQAAEDFGAAAALLNGIPRQTLRLQQASALWLDGEQQRAIVLVNSVDEFLDGTPDQTLACTYNDLVSVLDSSMPARVEC